MKKKDPKPTVAGLKNCRQARTEKKAVKRFNSELQKAIDAVDWAKVKLPKLQC